MERTISSRQLMTLSFVSMLSPFLRLLPGSVAEKAGSAGWVCALLSLIPAVLLYFLLTSFLQKFPSGSGLARSVLKTLGRFPGSVLLTLWSAWLVFHSGFLLCSGADRFIATIYPGVTPAVFIFVTALICLIAALGNIKSIARVSEIFQPLLLFVILLVLFFSVSEVEPTFLLPITATKLPDILSGVPLAAESVSVVLVNAAFLSKFTVPETKKYNCIPWLVGVTVLSVLFCGVAIGSLGKTYVSALAYPFFIMARDLSVLSGVERIEALVVGLWLLPDFILITVEWMIAADTLLLVFRQQNKLNSRMIWIAIEGFLAVFVAFRIAPNSESLIRWSEILIPSIQLSWAYLTVPLICLIFFLRKKF